jgi:uncharacterized protein YPO0396
METTEHSFPSTESLSPEPPRLGYRMHRLEVLNWGTFDRKIWTLKLNGNNALLTGDIGSGKSTLVDAVTTLLLPANRIAYNKAAGAESKERSLRTYVLGNYKSERSEETGAARPVALRKYEDYSVIVGVFRNEGYKEVTTLAQVFWFRDAQAQPERFYVCADRELSIAGEFGNIGPDMAHLRKRLRNLPGVEVHDTFSAYSASYRRRFHVSNDQAWELFHQTVSMKSVGNLTDFVREHMLLAPQLSERISDLLANFDDLTRAHAAVEKAKAQVGMLEPLVVDCDLYEQQTSELRVLKESREHLKAYYSERKLQLLEDRINHIGRDLERIRNRKESRLEQKAREWADVQRLKQSVSAEGGDRLEQIDTDLKVQQAETSKRKARAANFAEKLAKLDCPVPTDEVGFDVQQSNLDALRQRVTEEETRLQNELVEMSLSFRKGNDEHRSLVEELDSLRRRPSNIPRFYVQLRDQLAEAIGLKPEDLPFAGELLQVRPEEASWEGALERLFHGLALSLLVSEEHYPAVYQWINHTDLKGLLVYLRTLPHWQVTKQEALHPHSSANKVLVKADTRFTKWLQLRLRERHDYVCCSSAEDYLRSTRALSLTGQIKEDSTRHVKDDRFRLDDRSRYLLGWSNLAKIATLESTRRQLEVRLQESGTEIARLQTRRDEEGRKKEIIAGLREFRAFADLDWVSCEKIIARLTEERLRLETASDKLAELRGQLSDATTMLNATEEALLSFEREIAKSEAKLESTQNLKAQTEVHVVPIDPALRERITEVNASINQDNVLSVESCDVQEHAVRSEFQQRMDAEAKRQGRLKDRIILAMQKFKSTYPLETCDFDASIEAEKEYRDLLEQLRFHDLPKFEERFRVELRTNSIRRIALFHAKLYEESEEIKSRIDRINESLWEIEYNRGRYIELVQQPTFNPEVRQFRDDLRACIDNEMNGSADDQYTEAKFEQVKHILDRLRGRTDSTEVDRRWKELVTDVRNWFQFSASEKWREDDREHEHYSDSSGKSGGQKEKLAYTILAASVAYQFGLEWVEDLSRSFRFVVIDEAFGRGSDESAEFGLKLFAKLNLQLMIVTPLQKTHVIEPHVASVAFVENRTGQSSSVLNLSIEEHRRQKVARLS